MEEKQLPESTKWLMLGVAIFFDILSIIPVVDWFVWVIANFTFFLWFKMHGLSFSKPKNILGWALADIIEIIPFISIIPAWTGLILYLTRGKKIVDKAVSMGVPGNSLDFRNKNTKSGKDDDLRMAA